MPLPPLVPAVLALLVGIVASLRTAPPPEPLLVAAAALLGLVAVAGTRRPATRHLELLLLVVFAAAGAALGAARAATPDCREAIPARAEVKVAGVLGAGLYPDEPSDGPPLLPLEHAVLRAGENVCRAPVRAILPDPAPAALAGSRVHLHAEWVRSTRAGGPSPWPSDGYRTGYLRAVRVDSVSPPRLLEHPLLTLRGRTEDHLHHLFPDHFALVEALLLGRRERLDPALRDRFTRAGLTHLLAISGSHVAVLAGALVLVGAALRLPRRRTIRYTIAAVAVYLGVIGAPASALRAGMMIAIGLMATLLQRPSALLAIAAAACAALVALEPLAVLDVGLQLSFAGVLGIVAVQRTIGRRLRATARRKRWRWLVDPLLVSTAAFVATAPITAYHFGTVALVAIPANLPAIPLTGVALIGILGAALSAPLPLLPELLAAGAGLALDLLDRVATTAAALPYGSAAVDRARLGAWAAGAALAGIALCCVRRGRPAVRGITAAGTGAALLVAWPVLAHPPRGGLEIHFLDVGQGDAVALRTPRGRWLLVDAGPRGRDYDAGERRVLPFFRARGISGVEVLVLTHPDADHIGGAPAVLRGMRVHRVIEPGLPAGKELYLEMLRQVEERGVRWLGARQGRSLRLDGVEVLFLWPDSAALAIPVEANEASAVALVRYGEFSLLLPGDVSAEVEQKLVRRYGDALRSEVLKAGHHGSETSTSGEFLRRVDPELVVISAGRGNRYGHPAAEVLDRLTRAGVEIARTDQQGTVSLRVASPTGEPMIRIGR